MPFSLFSKSTPPSPAIPSPEPSSQSPSPSPSPTPLATTTATTMTTHPPPPPPPPPSTLTSPSTSTSTTPSTTKPFPLRPIALTVLVACPLLAILPPRKLDLYTFTLACTWSICARHVYVTSPSLTSPSPTSSFRLSKLPPETKLSDEGLRREEKEEGVLRRLWIGEKAGWEKRRMEEDRERMEEGLGIGDLIKERVREVFFGEEKEEKEEEEEKKEGEGKTGGNRDGNGNEEGKRRETEGKGD